MVRPIDIADFSDGWHGLFGDIHDFAGCNLTSEVLASEVWISCIVALLLVMTLTFG